MQPDAIRSAGSVPRVHRPEHAAAVVTAPGGGAKEELGDRSWVNRIGCYFLAGMTMFLPKCETHPYKQIHPNSLYCWMVLGFDGKDRFSGIHPAIRPAAGLHNRPQRIRSRDHPYDASR